MEDQRSQGTTQLERVNYSLAELGISSIESFIRLYLMIYLTDRIGLPPATAGYAVAIGVLWDAVSDPLQGWLSDKTRTPIGARLPWMIAGTPLLAVSFIQLFSVKRVTDGSIWPAFWEVTGYYLAVNTAMTMLSIPHLALGQDIAHDRDERTSLYAWRTLMTLLGLLTGTVTPVIFTALGYDSTVEQRLMATVVSLICVISAALTMGSMWQRSIRGRQRHGEYLSSSHTTGPIASPIKILMLAYFVATAGQGLNSTWALYYYRYRLEFSEQELGLVLVVFIASLCVTLPLWVYLARRFAKSRLIAAGTIALGMTTAIVYPFLPARELAGPLLMAVTGGIFLGSTGLLESMLVDVAEVSNVPESAMGRVFGIWKFVAKCARAAAIAIGGYLLGAIGYTPLAKTVEPVVAQKIGILFGPVVASFFLLAGVIIIYVRETRLKP